VAEVAVEGGVDEGWKPRPRLRDRGPGSGVELSRVGQCAQGACRLRHSSGLFLVLAATVSASVGGVGPAPDALELVAGGELEAGVGDGAVGADAVGGAVGQQVGVFVGGEERLGVGAAAVGVALPCLVVGADAEVGQGGAAAGFAGVASADGDGRSE